MTSIHNMHAGKNLNPDCSIILPVLTGFSMALVNIDSALKDVLSRLRKLAPPQGIEVLSYKRNRSIRVMPVGDGRVLVHERGYAERKMEIETSELQKVLGAIFKKEFPRSRKVRVCRVLGTDGPEKRRKRL
jgi:hypothetical protein